MSAKTKIVVLHMKRIVFAGVAAGLILILAVLLIVFLKPDQRKPAEESVPTLYVPGVYTSSVQLGDHALDVQVTVDADNINSISLVNLDETTETMYPLVKPALEELSGQITASQSLDDLTYSKNNQYTSMILIDAIKDALQKAASE